MKESTQSDASSVKDIALMSLALKLAKRGRFFTSPNPHCGAVIVKNGRVIGKGFHKTFGGRHAEIVAIESVKSKEACIGATLYTNLEPCSHWGKTPPCVDRIIEAGIKEVVIAMEDPNPIVCGIERLKAAGIRVRTGIMEEKAKELNEWYIKYIKKKTPYVTVKVALTLDGRIATKKGEGKWITGEKARDYANLLRCEEDGVVVGINTIIKDDPKLTCRRKEKSLKRIILDTKLRMPLNCQLLKEPGEVIIFCGARQESEMRSKREALEAKGARVIGVRERRGLLCWSEILKELYHFGCARVLIEGGARVISSAFKEGIVDKFVCFFSPKILGMGLSFSDYLSSSSLREAIRLKDVSLRRVGEEFLLTGYVHRFN